MVSCRRERNSIPYKADSAVPPATSLAAFSIGLGVMKTGVREEASYERMGCLRE
jgi:hypothetical protein